MQEPGILIVDEDSECRTQMADMFTKDGYRVTATNSLAGALYDILKKTVQVVLLGSKSEEFTATDIIPLLKQCNSKLSIIVVTANASLPQARKLRSEGIFYQALKPVDTEGREEIRQAVKCAFKNLRFRPV
jgi:DNA-binding NtrC family response regulator